MTPERAQLTYGSSISSDNEGLSLVQGAHDSTAVIAEFALRDSFAHSASVAPSATLVRSTSDACLTALRELIV